MSVLDSLWVEKYRPKSLAEVALPHNLRNNISEWVSTGSPPHVLFYGPAGSGKTTTALILTEMFADEEDRLIINGSYYRGIGDVRDQILPFVRQSPLSVNSKVRIVLLDEADSITGDAWKSLRHIIEQYSKYTRFILTCNYVTKIPDPIQSRMQTYEFKEYDVEECQSIVESILSLEDVSYSTEQVRVVIEKLYPDLRKIINAVQSLSIRNESGQLILDTSKIDQVLPAEDKIVDLTRQFFNGQIDARTYTKEVEGIVKTKWLDYTGLYTSIFNVIPENMLQYRVLVNRYAYQHSMSISEDMNFLSMIYEIAGYK